MLNASAGEIYCDCLWTSGVIHFWAGMYGCYPWRARLGVAIKCSSNLHFLIGMQ